MFQGFVLATLGISGSLLALVVICSFLAQVAHGEAEKTCQIHQYLTWLMTRGTPEQKAAAAQLKGRRNLTAIKAVVGYGILVDK